MDRKEYNKQWREKHREWSKAWRLANRQHLREYQRKYHATHREHARRYNTIYRSANRSWYLRYMKMWREQNKERLKAYDRNYWRMKHPRGGESMFSTKHYSEDEVRNIVNDSKAGKPLSHLKLDYNRSRGAIRNLLYNYGRFQNGDRRYMSVRMLKIFADLSSGNNHGVEVVAEKQNPDSLAKLDLAFQALQKVIVEVIDEEVNKRGEGWVKRAIDAEAELKKYKEAAQQSSMVGMLRKRWGLGS